jgi:NADH dehydrogenase (ubiquinone) Fe-S protein 2
MEFYERVSGARLHAAYIRPGGVSADLPGDLMDDIHKFCKNFVYRITEMEEMLSGNRILQNRLKNVGIISAQEAYNHSFSGVMLRGSGEVFDLRRVAPYDAYDQIDFDIPVGKNGDSFDRFLIRIQEMRQSLTIINQVLDQLPKGEIRSSDAKLFNPQRGRVKSKMEELIAHFKHFSEGLKLPLGGAYRSVEAPKGEFGILLYVNPKADGVPYRCRIRAPGFHLQGLDFMSQNLLLADLVTLIGTLDIVFGEVDR